MILQRQFDVIAAHTECFLNVAKKMYRTYEREISPHPFDKKFLRNFTQGERAKASLGFTLIEVIIGILIASLLSVVVYRMFSHTSRIVTVSSELIENTSDVMIAANQLERDISGIVVLKEHALFAQQQTSEKAAEKQGASDTHTSSIDLAESPQERHDEKKESEVEQLAFSGIIKDNTLSSLSFVCTNALPSVDRGGSRLVRVRYFLVPDHTDATLSQLMREERRYQPRAMSGEQPAVSHAYVLLPHIASLSVKFHGTLYGTKNAQSSLSAGEPIVLSSWGNEEQRKKLKRLVPEYLEMSGECRNPTSGGAVPFTYYIPIPAGIAEGMEARNVERAEQEKAAKEKKA